MTDMRSSDLDVNRAIRSWLHEDRYEDASRIAGAVLDQVETTPRRRATWSPAWRMPIMNKFVTIGLGAAAVVILALLAATQLLDSPGGIGGPGEEATPSPEASTIVSPTPAASVPGHGSLPEGPHLLANPEPGDAPIPPLTVTIPGPGWNGDIGGATLFREADGVPDAAGMIVFARDGYDVFGDPCRWQATGPITARTVDEFIAALAAQPARDASEPVDITIDGYTGQAITLHIREDADFSQCDQNRFGSWDCGDPGVPVPCGFNSPGETSIEYIFDVDGTLVAWHTDYQADTGADIVSELETLVLSARFGE